MLVRITNRCYMGCHHCLANATPDGEDMSRQTFKEVIAFSAMIEPLLLLSGGEPTEHPDLTWMLETSADLGLSTIVLSNGEFLHNKAPKRRDKILKLAKGVQVTNDPRYYPRRVKKWSHPKVFWEDKLRVVSPMGRAVGNRVACNAKGPGCFNLRSLTRSMGLLRALFHLRSLGRMCTPSVNVNGIITVGEAPGCAEVGSVTDSLQSIERNITRVRCNSCGLIDGLSRQHQQAVGQLYEVEVRAEYSPDYYAYTCDEVEDEEQATEDGLPPTEEG